MPGKRNTSYGCHDKFRCSGDASRLTAIWTDWYTFKCGKQNIHTRSRIPLQVQSEIAKKWDRYRLVSRCSDGTSTTRAVSARRMTTTMSTTYVTAAPSTARTTRNGTGAHQTGIGISGRRSARGSGIAADCLSTSPATMTYNCSIIDDSSVVMSSWAPNASDCCDASSPSGRGTAAAAAGSDVSGSDCDDDEGQPIGQGPGAVAMKRLDKRSAAAAEKERFVRWPEVVLRVAKVFFLVTRIRGARRNTTSEFREDSTNADSTFLKQIRCIYCNLLGKKKKRGRGAVKYRPLVTYDECARVESAFFRSLIGHLYGTGARLLTCHYSSSHCRRKKNGKLRFRCDVWQNPNVANQPRTVLNRR